MVTRCDHEHPACNTYPIHDSTSSSISSSRRRRKEQKSVTRILTSSTRLLFGVAVVVVGVAVSHVPCHCFSNRVIASRHSQQQWQQQQQQQQQQQTILQMASTTTTSTTTSSSSSSSSSSTTTSTTTSSSSSSSAAAAAAAMDLEWSEFSDGSSSTRTTPVIFLHGMLGSKRNFASIGKSLSKQLEHKRRLLAVDLRNHGENHHDWRDEMNYEVMALDVITFLDKQSIDKAILVGHSMGGKVASTLALLYPERIEGLVVIDIAPITYDVQSSPQWKLVVEILNTLHSVKIPKDESGKITKKSVDDQLKKAIPDIALRSFCLTNLDVDNSKWKMNLNVILKEIDTLAGFPPLLSTTTNNNNNDDDKNKKQYHGDVFFINGGQSRFIKHSHIKTIEQYFPNYMLTTIRGVGHWVHAEAPDDTVALLKRYLDR